MPVSDRDYAVDIGYRCADGRWLTLARSAPVRVPPVYPSDWIEDQFITVSWDEDLRDKTVYTLVPPSKRMATEWVPQRLATPSTTKSLVWRNLPKLSELPVPSTVPCSKFQFTSRQSAPMSSPLVLDVGCTDNVGFDHVWCWDVRCWLLRFHAPDSSSPVLVGCDAELIVYGATEPDANVTIGGRPIKLNPDGTFRFQMSFQDGLIDYPIMAVAADGEQTRSIHMKFNRETPIAQHQHQRRSRSRMVRLEKW
jgi:hypothetical protein